MQEVISVLCVASLCRNRKKAMHIGSKQSMRRWTLISFSHLEQGPVQPRIPFPLYLSLVEDPSSVPAR